MPKPQVDPKLAKAIAEDMAAMDTPDADVGNKIKPKPQRAAAATCPDCQGKGLIDEFTRCPRCKGEGHITVLK